MAPCGRRRRSWWCRRCVHHTPNTCEVCICMWACADAQVNILRELRHPFIVRYYDRIIDKAATRIYIIQEYCEGGDVSEIIRKAKRDG